MRSLEGRRHKALDDISDNEYTEKNFRKKMGNAGPLKVNDQDVNNQDQFENAMKMLNALFSEEDVGRSTISVSTAEKEAVYKELRAALMKDIEELNATSEKLKSL